MEREPGNKVYYGLEILTIFKVLFVSPLTGTGCAVYR